MEFKNGVKNIQAADYNGARMVHTLNNSLGFRNPAEEFTLHDRGDPT